MVSGTAIALTHAELETQKKLLKLRQDITALGLSVDLTKSQQPLDDAIQTNRISQSSMRTNTSKKFES